MKPFKRIAILSNATKTGTEEAATHLKQLAEQHGIEVIVSNRLPVPEGILRGADACFVMGGDGTLLSVMSEATKYKVPVAGVRYGQLGFLATISPQDLESKMPAIFRGNYLVKTRSLLSYGQKNGDEKPALNDLVVKSGSNGRLARFSVFSDAEKVADYSCDGIVFSTPTGSTAYNLAAGGPIVHPDAQVVLMTPISAHTLTSRSVVFPSGVSLRVHSHDNPDPPLVSADGQAAFDSPPEFPLEISVSTSTFPLLAEQDHSHFRVLRNKLKWD